MCDQRFAAAKIAPVAVLSIEKPANAFQNWSNL